MSDFHEPNALWRKCEVAWMNWIQKPGSHVIPLTEAVGGVAGRNAPVMKAGSRMVRSPDFLVTATSGNVYWEVKFRSRSTIDANTGIREHWMSASAFRDYHHLAVDGQAPVNVILYELSNNQVNGRWLQINVLEVMSHGRPGVGYTASGDSMEAWYWPVSSMIEVDGPEVLIDSRVPVLPNDDIDEAPELGVLTPIEREFRRGVIASNGEKSKSASSELGAKISTAIHEDHQTGLDILRQSLGINSIPLYSVLVMGDIASKIDEVLGLLDYGIRLFLITPEQYSSVRPQEEISALMATRLLEWSVTKTCPNDVVFCVDGNMSQFTVSQHELLESADNLPNGINVRQFKIVHSPIDSDLLITAGAGTGKTETMTERVMYLLSCSGSMPSKSMGLNALNLSEIALITFTRESASEMRARLSRTLLIRLRLAKFPVHPLIAWLMQLGSAQISTIHAFAKLLVSKGGNDMGYSPKLRLSPMTLELRKMFVDQLSLHLPKLYKEVGHDVEPVHEWVKKFHKIWQDLENNGVLLSELVEGSIDWGSPEDDKSRITNELFKDILREVAIEFRTTSKEDDVITVNQLAPLAHEAVSMGNFGGTFKFLFVDEFQDTDPIQMKLIAGIREYCQSRLFVVGDPKQAIYRFRGAEGDAFNEMRSIIREKGFSFSEHSLAINFRTDGKLLKSFEPYFVKWGARNLLPYLPGHDDLIPNAKVSKTGQAINFVSVKGQAATSVPMHVQQLLKAGSKEIAIICRSNSEALSVRNALRDENLNCELYVGGNFYQSNPVLEFQALLKALEDPRNLAKVLQLFETQWFSPLMLTNSAPAQTNLADLQSWGSQAPVSLSWSSRVATQNFESEDDNQDISFLANRLMIIRKMLESWSVIDLVGFLRAEFAPEDYLPEALENVDNIEIKQSHRHAYSKALDHLISILDENFAGQPLTLTKLVEWLDIQIATNDNEDLPLNRDDLAGKIVAVTVHKSKGLEFDAVILPFVSQRFKVGPFFNGKDRFAILRQKDQNLKVLWQWSGKRNFASQMWAGEDLETEKEETRLLYVAMTRAKHHLYVYVKEGQVRSAGKPSSWKDLLNGN
jgi:DNA helicase-2/ATP-dependent DNA helicase PcrA